MTAIGYGVSLESKENVLKFIMEVVPQFCENTKTTELHTQNRWYIFHVVYISSWYVFKRLKNGKVIYSL